MTMTMNGCSGYKFMSLCQVLWHCSIIIWYQYQYYHDPAPCPQEAETLNVELDLPPSVITCIEVIELKEEEEDEEP